MSDQQIESEIQAKGLTAPRVTRNQIEAAIASIDIVTHTSASGQILRWAVLNMVNGYAVVGRPSVAVSPENDDAELGKKIATDNSINEVWPLLGYELKTKLAVKPKSFQERVRQELADRTGELDRLSAFIGSPTYRELPMAEQDRLTEQRMLMIELVNVLARRIGAFSD